MINDVMDKVLKSSMISEVIYIGVILLVAFASYYVLRFYVARLVYKLLTKKDPLWQREVEQSHLLSQTSYLAPALVLSVGANWLPWIGPHMSRLLSAYIFVHMVLIAGKFITIGTNIYDTYPISKDKPVKGYAQLVKIILYILGSIIAFCIIQEKSLVAVLSGVGALTAVLLLIFRDTILSVVASVQIVSNDLFRKGDWIEVPQFGADGAVVDIALHVIKVQNFDKTITSIPTHKLLETSVKNWRGMQNTGGRRIKRSIYIDTTSIRFLTADDIERLKDISLLAPYFEKKNKELATYNASRGVLERRSLTNVGTYRAYIDAYLKNHPLICQDFLLLVRQLQPTSDGLPIELYTYVSDTSFVGYEGTQADIFDHLFSCLYLFDLRSFQNATGHDYQESVLVLKDQRTITDSDSLKKLTD
jgi:miniconductance mechanosensitive channel